MTIWKFFTFGGNWLFMFPLLAINLLIIYLIIRKIFDLFIKVSPDKKRLKRGLSEIIQLATFALFCGIFFQLIGLYQAMGAIEEAGSISQGVLAGGLRFSMTTTLYGAFIFCFSVIPWFFLKQRYLKLSTDLE